MREQKSKMSELKMDLTVKDVKEFLKDIPDNTKFTIVHPVKNEGYNFDNLSLLEYNVTKKKVYLNGLDTTVLMGLDEIMPLHNSIKVAFTAKEKRIKRLVYEI